MGRQRTERCGCSGKELEPVFTDAGSNIEAAHFNAFEGIDRWKDVECLVAVGRPLPAPRAVEDMAAALTGKPVTLPEYPHPSGRPQQMLETRLPIQLKNGTEWPLLCRVFGLPEAELIRQAVTEAQLVQAIGRARGVNRTASNPVEAWLILDDTTVPIAVDAVVDFRDIEPGKIDLMIEQGLVPQWSIDAFKLYPGLWPTSQAARKAYQRDGLDVARNRRNGPIKASTVTSPYRYILKRKCHSTRLIRYQPKARGGGATGRLALVDTAKMHDAKARLEAALGELAVLEELDLPPD